MPEERHRGDDQRQVLYEVMKTMYGHPSPEEVYAQVKKRGAGYLAGYRIQKHTLFVESGVFREVSMHHGSLRAEMNDESHRHMVCSKCKAITDIGEKELRLVSKRTNCPVAFWCSGMQWM